MLSQHHYTPWIDVLKARSGVFLKISVLID